jgi:hypothetical protein
MATAVGDGVTDDTAALQQALTAGPTCRIPAGRYVCTADLLLPVGEGCVDLEGDGWNATQILFLGAGVTRGLYLHGDIGLYPKAGTIRNLAIKCYNGASRGLTGVGLDLLRLERLQITGAAGAGLWLDGTIMTRVDQCLIGGNGSATEANIEVDHSTTFCWTGTYISGSHPGTPAGLRLDRTVGVQIIGGAIESTGIPIQIGSKAEAVYGCSHGTILAVDLENPGAGNPFMEAGYGWTGTLGQGVRAWDVRACQGWPSGTPSAPYGIKLKHTTAMGFDNCHWVQPGTPTATYWLEGVTNVGTVVRASRSNAG